MFTRVQKDLIWDIFPASYVIPSKDPTNLTLTTGTVTFLKDLAEVDKDIQCIESFSPEIVRYPTIQYQFAEATVRANFMFFKLGEGDTHDTYQTANNPDSWQNIKSSPLTFDITKDSLDATSRLSVMCRMPTPTVTSYLRFEIEKEYQSSGTYTPFFLKNIYPQAFGQTGKLILFKFSYPYLDVNTNYRFKLTNFSVGTDDTGLEVALDSGSDPVHELYKPQPFEAHGNIEDLIMSVRVASDSKIPERLPGTDLFCNAQDIVDKIIQDIELAFFRDFDDLFVDSNLVTVSRVMDITPALSSGQSEQVVGKQVDFLIANKNELQTEYTTPTSANIEYIYE